MKRVGISLAVVALFTGVLLPHRANAAEVPAVPSNNRVEMDAFSSRGWTFRASVDGYLSSWDEGWFNMQRETWVDKDHKTIVREGIYLEDMDYRFDPVLFEASVHGTKPTIVTRETWERRGGRWYVTDTWRWAKAKVSVAWRAAELPVLKQSPGLMCAPYAPPGTCVPDPSLWRSAPASVTGSMSFAGLGVTVKLPRGVTGTMLHRLKGSEG